MHNIENLKKYPISILSPKGLGAVSIVQPFNNAKSGLFNMEIWKDIKGYEGLYQSSNLGRIKSLTSYVNHHRGDKRINNGQIIKQYIGNTGYYRVRLSKKNIVKNHSVHKLVAMAYIPNPQNKPCINHKNLNKQINIPENLEWCTYSENMKHAYKMGALSKKGEKHHLTILKDSDILKIRELYKNNTQTKIAELFNMDQSTISSIIHKKTWKHIQ